ncbi:MAG: 1-phosphofructokinase [Anaerovoracaceae bacterium]|jgi:1-phosphofructokinase
MIYTVTFNPAIDYVVQMDRLVLGETNRTRSEEVFFGGKGVNVSVILRRLGAENTALGFISGFTGRALADNLRRQRIACDFIELDESAGITRINMKIKGHSADGGIEETEINGQGPQIPAAAVQQLLARIGRLSSEDLLIVSGSVPSSMPADTYEQILKITSARGITTAVDATGQLLLNVLPFRPFLIKPNSDELAEMLQRPSETTADILSGAAELQQRGARNVIVSRGAKGAVLLTEGGEEIIADPIPGRTVNSVGAGDSMVAGFLAGWLQTHDYHYAMHLGTAAGSATACSPGLAAAEEIQRRMGQ